MKTAIVSVSDKTNIDMLGRFLKEYGYTILSTGGTASVLKNAGLEVTEISDYTGMPEILNGRVKTLHPKIYGGILNITENPEHQTEIQKHNITNIDLVVVNLYPFQSKPSIENIDIGGVTLLRAAAKNYKDVTVLTDPSQYNDFMEFTSKCISGLEYDVERDFDEVFLELYRKKLAKIAFTVTSKYDTLIKEWFSESDSDNNTTKSGNSDKSTDKSIDDLYLQEYYEKFRDLKYGCNPHQTEAALYIRKNSDTVSASPFKVLNGDLGYINTLDALNSWKLVSEIKEATGLPAATSFKHVSPAGVAFGTEPNQSECKFLGISSDKVKKYSPIAIAYIRARNCDPKSSFGDFIAVNEKVDITLANYVKSCVTDGIIAPDYTEEALEILQRKKSGKYVILQGNRIEKSKYDYREYGGFLMKQTANNHIYTEGEFTNIATKNTDVSSVAIRDMIMSMITMKYTQSNSVGYAFNGQMIGIAAGQQSRIDCTIMARHKAEIWFLRQHPHIYKYIAEHLDSKMKRQDKINAVIQYIDNLHMEQTEIKNFVRFFLENNDNADISYNNKHHLILASDGFFPFSDSVQEGNKINITHIVQPGGSVADQSVVDACDTENICMINTGVRAFHH